MIIASSYPYTGNGLGGLPDAIEAIATHEVNGQYELFFRYPLTGLHFEELANGKIVMAKPDDLTDDQPFRIYRVTKPLNGVVSGYARHISYDMSGTVVEPFTADSLTTAIQTIPTKCTPASPFTLATSRTVASPMSLKEPRPLWKLLGGQEGSLLDVYGGEWDFDKLTATLVTKLGQDRGVSIRYGKNLTSLEQDATIEGSYSGVYPYWYDEKSNTLVTLTEKVVPVTGSIVSDKVLTLNCSDDFEDQPTEAQLRARANAYISANSIGNMNTSWKISFVDTEDFIDQVALGDTVHVYYSALDVNVTARVVKTEYDVLKGKYKSITVGRVKQNLASIIVNDQRETEEKIKTTKSFLEKAIDDATYSITHGGGVFRLIYDGYDLKEIVSLDNADITQALSVWRWNNGGFGHSSTGYNGPYTLALLPDGSINADLITTGTLNANVIRAGLLQDAQGLNSWNLDTGVLSLTGYASFTNLSTAGQTTITGANITTGIIKDAANKNSWNLTTGALTITDGSIVVTHNRTFYYSSYSSTDLTTIVNIVNAGTWTDAQLEKYDFNLDGQITLADRVILNNMLTNHQDRTVSIKTEIDPSKTNRPICIYDGNNNPVTYLSPNAIVAPSGSFGSRMSVGDSRLTSTGYFALKGASASITFFDSNGTQTGYIGNDINDYVIEKGKSGDWIYRKWYSGVYECWLRRSVPVAIQSAWGYSYYGTVPTVAYPVAFAASPHEQVSVVGGYGWAWIAGYATTPTTSASGAYILMRGASAASASYNIDYYVRGQLP